MIPFNVPAFTGNELEYVLEAIKSKNYSGDGFFSKKCQEWFEINFQCKKALITPSCTSALDMAAILLEIEPGDEVIMPSFTFVSTANAFVLRGATIVYVDIEPKTMNIDVAKIEKAITSKTKAIVPVHYAGVSCDMDTIMNIANLHDLYEKANKGENKDLFITACKFIGLFNESNQQWLNYKINRASVDESEIENMINLRNKARDNKKYEEADKIRDQLLDKGVLIEDKNGKTLWKFK